MTQTINNILLIILGIIPVAIISMYVYQKDKNKEPIGLLVLLVLGGIFSCFLVLSLSNILIIFLPFMSTQSTFLDVFLYAFVGVAFVEEVCKFLMTYALSYRHREFDEIYDMLSYAIFVALGFACFENILYILNQYSLAGNIMLPAVEVGLKRAITAIPGHACDGLFMGYYLSLAKVSAKRKNKEAERNNILKSIFVPILIHGIYDFCCFSGLDILMIVFIVFIIVIDIIALKKLNYVAKINRSINSDRINRKIENPEENKEKVEQIKNSVTAEANSYNQSDEKNSEYFTVAPERPRPTASWHGDNFKFENSGVPYVPDLIPHQHIEEAPPITKEQHAEYIPILPDVISNEEIPELSPGQLPNAKKNYCVYCGAKLNGDFCKSCGHEAKK